MDLNSLPTEMLSHIFSYLSSYDLCRLTGQVCQKWQILSYHPSLWQTVELDERVQTPNEKTHIINNASLARSFVFTKITVWRFLSLLPKQHHARRLEFVNCDLDKFCVRKLVTRLPSIEYVRLTSRTYIKDDIIRRIAEWVFLKDLTLIGSQLDGNNCFYVLAEKCKYLENVNMRNYLSFDNRALLAFAKSRGEKLKSFALYFGAISTTDGYKFLTHCPNIIDLRMDSAMFMTGNDLLYLKELKSLQRCEIDFAWRLTAQNFVDLFLGQIFLNLLHLSLASCDGLNDLAVELMSNSCPFLKKLFITHCLNVTDHGIQFVVTNSRNLEILTLALDISGECLLDISNKMPNLVHLDIDMCHKITTKARNELKSNNSSIIIDTYYDKYVRLCE